MKKLFSTITLSLCLLIAGVALARPSSPSSPSIVAAARVAEGQVNINSAKLEQLVLLPGIGPSKAQAIIAARSKRPFKRKTQLLRVRGIGAKTLARLRPYICVDGETTLTHKIGGLR